MTRPRPDEKSLFNAARQITDPADQLRFLENACRDQPELAARVRDLLEADDDADGFLEPPKADGDATVSMGARPPEVGDWIGRWKLLQQIGEGGMGIVFLAEQHEPVARRVALKVIRPGMDSRHVIGRFETERRALALMDHPNIARVFDAGTTDAGLPFFVMELVKGIPLNQYCDEHHLTPEERLQLFVPVCQAVQHAHQKGVIHRDLKPSNILVARYDDRPVPKIIDFGVAKAVSQRLTEKTMFTEHGQVVGTIDYMSPEQAQFNQLDVDTRTDIYSLGVLLYELLAGETPFDRRRLRAAAFDELLRIIREEDPPRPSIRLSSSQSLPTIAANRRTSPAQLSLLVRGDLDWIVMKALEKDRSRRYDNASSLADDLRRHLANEPVAACPPSMPYRFRKFARRNRLTLSAAAAVAVSLLLGLCGAIWQADRARRAERNTEAKHVEAIRLQQQEARQRRLAEEQAAIAAEQKKRAYRAMANAKAVAEEHRAQLVRSLVSEAGHRLSNGDLMGALPELVEALRLDDQDPRRQHLHRVRLAAVLRQCPVPVRLWPSAEPVMQIMTDRPGNLLFTATAASVSVADLRTGRPQFPPLRVSNSLTCAALSPDGTHVALAAGRVVTIHSASSGEMVVPKLLHSEPVRDITWHPSGDALASASGRTIRVWHPFTVEGPVARHSRTFGRSRDGLWHDTTQSIRFLPESDRLLVLWYSRHGNGARVSCWDPLTDAVQPFVAFNDSSPFATRATVSPDGSCFWCYDALRDIGSGARLPGSPESVPNPHVVFSPDGHYLVLADRDGFEARVLNTRTGRLGPRPLHSPGQISCLAVGPEGGRVAIADVNGFARIWDLNAGQPLTPPLRHGGAVTHVHFCPNGHQILTASVDGLIRLWELIPETPAKPPLFITNQGNGCDLTGPNGQCSFTAEDAAGELRDAERTVPRALITLEGRAECAAFSPDESRIVVGTNRREDPDEAGGIEVRDTRTGDLLFPPLQQRLPIQHIRFLTGGDAFLSVSHWNSSQFIEPDLRTADGAFSPAFRGSELILRQTASGAQLLPAIALPDFIQTIAISPDEALLAVGGGPERDRPEGSVTVVDLQTGQVVWRVEVPRRAGELYWSPDGNTLACTETTEGFPSPGRHDRLVLRAARSGNPRHELPVPGGIRNLSFDPAASRLAVACRDGTVKLIHLESEQPAAEPFRYAQRTVDVAFLHDGSFLLTANERDNLQLWDAAAQLPISPPVSAAVPQYWRYLPGGHGPEACVFRRLPEREWNFAPTPLGLEHLEDAAQVLSCAGPESQLIESDASPVSSLTFLWSRWKAAAPQSFQRVTDDVCAWHQAEALRYSDRDNPQNLPAAIWHLDRLLDLTPERSRSWLVLRAGLRQRVGNLDGADDDYSEALARWPDDTLLLHERANVRRRLGDFEGAAADLDEIMTSVLNEYRAVAGNPAAARNFDLDARLRYNTPWLDLATLWVRDNHVGEYRRLCLDLLELYSAVPTSGDGEAEVESLPNEIIRLIAIHPHGISDSAELTAFASVVLEKAGERLSPATRGMLQYQLGRLEDARETLEAAVANSPQSPEALVFLSRIAHDLGRKEQVRKWTRLVAEWLNSSSTTDHATWRQRTVVDALMREVGRGPQGAAAPPENRDDSDPPHS